MHLNENHNLALQKIKCTWHEKISTYLILFGDSIKTVAPHNVQKCRAVGMICKYQKFLVLIRIFVIRQASYVMVL